MKAEPGPREVEVQRALTAEQECASFYAQLARIEKDPGWRALLDRLADEERQHAAHWAAVLPGADPRPDGAALSMRSRLLLWLAARLGTRAVAPFLAARERGDISRYRTVLVQPEMKAQERNHARVFAALAAGERDVALAERWHGTGAFNLRAAIFGVNDGLVSNLSLVMGVAGAGVGPGLVVLAGAAGLVAGAFSMAGGEYVSVQSQRELLERQLDLERLELEESPEDEARELARIYQNKGLGEGDARQLAATVMADPKAALDTLARDELGLNPNDLGSPLWAAASSFTAFAGGALVPLLPYLVLGPRLALPLSILASALSLFGIGALLAILTGRSPLASGARMLAVGAAAAAITFGVGRLLGTAVG